MTIDGVAGPWPAEFPIAEDGSLAEGLPVWSLSGAIEGRTTGARLPCHSHGCPGWFIGVRWETGQLMQICSEGWRYDPVSRSVRMKEGAREISSTSTSIPDRRQPPLPRSEWPSRESLRRWKGWRVGS